MSSITYDEQQMIAIYHAGTRAATISVLEEILRCLEADEVALRVLTCNTISKLKAMTDDAYRQMDLIPDFSEEQNVR